MGVKLVMIGWLFPGQGSQYVGMGLDLKENSEKAKEYFDISNEIMNCDIQSIIFNGPEELLKKTEYTQPAIYIVSVITGYLLIDKGLKPTALAGHSLGEYSALAIGGAFDFTTGLKLVKSRSENMANAGMEKSGTMAALVGLDDETVINLCKSYDGNGVVVPANFNSPGQVVISGNINAVEWAIKSSKDAGARMAVELNVSGAFHSPLMSPARENLAEMINSLEISNTVYPVFTNVDAKPVTKAIDIKSSLIQQLENPVLWAKSILEMKNKGINHFIEVGPGKVLQGLNKRIDRSIISQGVDSITKLEQIDV
ncbi:MAG: malonyl CoA-acyl carrier protein transacylase [Candidatus Neomarinimicrobiota bacterium]|nr:MAG: malonyl CoA-acyl carrier protein transacylase [Candidatus Neomarinimicrobiota bacterium]